MACESPCFDCPYLKGSDKLEIADNVIFDYMFKHHTGEGGYESVICPEQEDICFGQLQMIANGLAKLWKLFLEIQKTTSMVHGNIWPTMTSNMEPYGRARRALTPYPTTSATMGHLLPLPMLQLVSGGHGIQTNGQLTAPLVK